MSIASTPRSGPGSLISLESTSSIFPHEWIAAPVSAEADPIDRRDSTRARAAIESGLAKYPPGLLRENLERVYLVGGLRYSGIAAAGTNSLRRVYLADRGRANGYTNSNLEETFHAEFSSILLRNHAEKFDTRAWLGQNPKLFSYGAHGDAISAIKSGRASDTFEPSRFEEGFLTEYSATDAENDFNAFAEYLWTGDRRLWDAASRHVRIRGKLELTIAFYRALDSRLDEAFFRALKNDRDGQDARRATTP